MKTIIDETAGEVIVENGGREVRHPLASAEGFAAASRAWIRAGWDTKYVYTFSWLGRPIIQLPDDIIRMQEPQFTSGLEMATIRRLIASGGFAGIKDSSGDWCRMAELLELKREFPFALFCGSDRLAARALSEGADGVISDCACAMPEFAPGDPRLIEFLDWIEKLPPLTAVKRALELRGQKAGAPLTPLAAETTCLLEEFALWFKTVKDR